MRPSQRHRAQMIRVWPLRTERNPQDCATKCHAGTLMVVDHDLAHCSRCASAAC